MNELTTQLATEFTGWRKASHSQPTNDGACVEVAHSSDAIGVRDSKNAKAGTLVFSPVAWSAFTDELAGSDESVSSRR